MRIDTLARGPGLFARGLLDLLLPPRCAACREVLSASRPPLCPLCLDALVPAAGGECLRCGSPSEKSELLCPACREFGPLKGVGAVWQFGGPLADAIWSLKHTGSPALTVFFAAALAELLSRSGWPAAHLVAVPMHRRRFTARGFNQAVLLARRLGRLAGLSVAPGALERTRAGPPQTSLSGQSRRRSVVGAFRARPELLPPGPLCLVDDVVTTGATLLACAEALRAAGATEVYALCLAQTLLQGAA